MFGVSCAPEMYQMTLQQTLSDCKGVRNILHDIIVVASSEREHNEKLKAVLRRNKESSLTLSKEKCWFNKSELEVMSHVLSGKGIAPKKRK